METTGPSLIAQATTGLLKGASGRAAAMGEKQLAETNAYIGRTRAIQTSAAMAEDLNSELSSMRAVFAANQQRPNVGTFELMQELRDVRSRERRIAYANEMAGVYDARMQAQNAKAKARAAMLGGISEARQPVFDLYDYANKNRG
jgi:hypothetical protein